MKVKVLILYGYGINCDRETARGFELAGAAAERVHLEQLISGEKKLKEYQILALPGGFSFGDDLGAGKVLAVKIRAHLINELLEFIEEGKLFIGICNGFQVMVKLGVLPGLDKNYQRQETTLTFNDSGRFEDRWVYLKVNEKSSCVWLKGVERLYLPVRHGEGKFIFKDEKVKERVVSQNQIVAQYVDEKENLAGYPWNPNGSELSIAGICDETGRILGLMPHPEAFLFSELHPRWTREKILAGDGLKVFQNAVNYVIREM